LKNDHILNIKIIISGSVFILAGFISCNLKNTNAETDLRPVSACTIYINSLSGNDKNPGTVRKPVKTITEINRRIKNTAACKDGARTLLCMFAGGQEFAGTLILIDINGPDRGWVTIGSYGEGPAIIDGGARESICVRNSSKIHIKNLHLKGLGRKGGNTTNGLSLAECRSCTVENIYSEGFQKSGVDLYNCTDIEVINVTAFDNGFCGINIMGSLQDSSRNILIKDCRAENNPGDPTRLDNHSGNGILVGVSDSVIIDHCTATNNGWDMPRQGNGPVGIWTWMSDHVTIQYCISYRNRTSEGGKDGGGFDLDGGVTNSLIQYCLSYENEGAGYGLFQYPGAADWSNNIIRYCVSINDAYSTVGAGSFFIWNGSGVSNQLSNCYIYNNVVYSMSAPVISFENASKHENFIFSNNIFLGKGRLISGENSGSKFAGNVWWSEAGKAKFMQYNSLNDWIKATGQESQDGKIIGVQTDPGLTGPFVTDITDPNELSSLSGYRIRPDSPVINKGVAVKTLYGFNPPSNDFYGNQIPEGTSPQPGIHFIYP
jgi:hypothetical protein